MISGNQPNLERTKPAWLRTRHQGGPYSGTTRAPHPIPNRDEVMDAYIRATLETAGYSVSDAAEFLELSPEDRREVADRVAAFTLRRRYREAKLFRRLAACLALTNLVTLSFILLFAALTLLA